MEHMGEMKLVMDNKSDKDQWTVSILDNVMKQTGMTESKICSITGHPDGWVEKVRNNEVELTLIDCYQICQYLNIELCQFFMIYNN